MQAKKKYDFCRRKLSFFPIVLGVKGIILGKNGEFKPLFRFALSRDQEELSAKKFESAYIYKIDVAGGWEQSLQKSV